MIQKYSNDIPEYVKTNLIRWVELLREYTGRGVKEDDFDIIPFIPSIPTFTERGVCNTSNYLKCNLPLKYNTFRIDCTSS